MNRIFLLLLACTLPWFVDAQSLLRKDISFYVNGQFLPVGLGGGIDNAQSSQADLDLDGFQDLFIFDRTGNAILPFLWSPALKKYIFSPQLRVQFPILKDWALMLDYNKDGFPDIFSSTFNTEGIAGIEVHIGYLDQGKLAFRKRISGYRFNAIYFPAGNGVTQVPCDYSDIPSFDDVDHDGDIDILLFEPGNNRLSLFTNLAKERGYSLDSLTFVLTDRCYGKFVESGLSSEITLSSSKDSCAMFHNPVLQHRHAGSTVLSLDLNGDNLRDLLIGDLENNHMVALINGGAIGNPYMISKDITWPSYDSKVDFPKFHMASSVDVDHDGKLDILIAPNIRYSSFNINNLWYYRNISTTSVPYFELTQQDFLVGQMVDVGSGASPTFVDYNQDGLYDLVVGSEGYFLRGNIRDARLLLFENKGTKKSPEFYLVDDNYLNFKEYSSSPSSPYFGFAPNFGDIDQDGDLDLLVGEAYGEFFFCENIAGPGKKFNFLKPVFPYKNLSGVSSPIPFMVDLNRDGLMDIVTGTRLFQTNVKNEICGSFIYYQNMGSKGNPVFDNDFSRLPNTPCLGGVLLNSLVSKINSAPAFYDFNGQYKLFAGNIFGEVSVFGEIENNLYSNFNLEHNDLGETREGEKAVLSLADIDDDGIVDMVLGNQRGGIAIFSTPYKTDGTSFTNHPTMEDLFTVYPNPAETQVVLNNKSSSDFTISMYTQDGKLVNTFPMEAGKVKVIHTDYWTNGLYLIQVVSQNYSHTYKLFTYH